MKLRTIIVLHHIIFWILLVTPLICIVYQPWYITICMTVFIVRVATSRDVCILTELEKDWRKELGWAPLRGGFIKHYYWRVK